MVQITVKKAVDNYGQNVTIYKNRNRIETKMLETENKVYVYCAGLRFSYNDIEKAKENTIKYLNNRYCFSGGVELIYK